ncbi:MAG: type IV pilus assembly protein PilM [Candidatus Hydrogenedentes bacterium]|nr:type IV pilus assembly protein PilM [Candidatus Hydrogenedentota bacterium]
MAGITGGRHKRLVLDIGASAIRLAELAQTKAGHQLVKYYQREFNSDPALDEEERKAIKQKALAELLKETKVRTRKTIFGVPGQSVFTRSRTLPPVPEYKVSQIVRYEIQQQIPFSLDQIAMDYQILGRTEAGGYDVMMAAIKVDVVDKLIEILTPSRRVIDVADVNPLAAYNWLKHTGEFGSSGECVALIDMGAATTDIVIEREGQFRFTRPLNLGGNDVTLAIASAFNMSFTDAERLKRQRGFAPTGDPNTDGQGGEVIGNVLQRMVSEIMRSFAYFRSLPGGGQVNRVVLCGGGACLRNIIPFMQRQLGLEVRIAQPLAGLAVAPGGQQVSEAPEQSCVALGMALRCQQTVALEINLIPPRVLEAARRREAALYWGLSMATLALTMACIIPQKAKENTKVLEEIGKMKTMIQRYDPELVLSITGATVPQSAKLKDFKAVQTQVSGLETQVKALEDERNFRNFWLEEMSLVNDSRPEKFKVWFSAIETTTITDAATATAAGPMRGGGGMERPGGGFGRLSGGINPLAGAGTPGAENEPTLAQPKVFSSGFPGVSLQNPTGLAAGGGGFASADEEEDDDRAGRRGGRSGMGGGAGASLQEFTRPNGLRVLGFAESSEAIQEFVENLKAAERTQANKDTLKVKAVHFSEASVLKLPQEILYQAWTTANQASRPSGAVGPVTGPAVYSFEVNIEFEGLYYKATPQVSVTASNAGLGRTGAAGTNFARPSAPATGGEGLDAAPSGQPRLTRSERRRQREEE